MTLEEAHIVLLTAAVRALLATVYDDSKDDETIAAVALAKAAIELVELR